MALDTIKTTHIYKPIVLVIIDGWGISPSWGGNAISLYNPPFIGSLWREYPHKVLHAFGKLAPESKGKMANSEIGHTTIGSGRLVKQDITDIDLAIKKESFFQNPTLMQACINTRKYKSNLHLIGLLSDGRVHSDIKHLFALLKLAKQEKVKNVFIHIISDGRDCEKVSIGYYLRKLQDKMNELKIGQIASICGRFYAMDRNHKWEQIILAYQAQVLGKGYQASSLKEAIANAYEQGLTDEFIPPTVIMKNNQPVTIINNNDSVIFFNTRSDRARELTQAYTDSKVLRKFLFWRKISLKKIYFVSLTSYRLDNSNIHVAFPPAVIKQSLAAILANRNLKQLHAAETEKYAHVTYFFNGGHEKPLPNEERIIIPSLDQKESLQKPEMSTYKLTSEAIKSINKRKFDFIVINLANVDMIGHTGDIIAIGKAINSVDKAIKVIVKATMKIKGAVIITSDHGNAEQMVNPVVGDAETLHTLNPVPFILITPENKKDLFKSAGTPYKMFSEIISTNNTLADIAPTILEMMGIAKPIDMTGHSLLKELE